MVPAEVLTDSVADLRRLQGQPHGARVASELFSDSSAGPTVLVEPGGVDSFLVRHGPWSANTCSGEVMGNGVAIDPERPSQFKGSFPRQVALEKFGLLGLGEADLDLLG